MTAIRTMRQDQSGRAGNELKGKTCPALDKREVLRRTIRGWVPTNGIWITLRDTQIASGDIERMSSLDFCLITLGRIRNGFWTWVAEADVLAESSPFADTM